MTRPLGYPGMGSYRGHLRLLDGLVGRAFDEAKRLGHGSLTDEHFLLALLSSEGPAGQVLREYGPSRELLEAELARMMGDDEPEYEGVITTAAAQHVLGLAEGIAAGQGTVLPAEEHVLLALLWDPDISATLVYLGSNRDEMWRALRELGVTLPALELPPPDPRRWGEEVIVPAKRIMELIRDLEHVVPKGTSFAWNLHEDERTGYITPTEGIDLAEYLPIVWPKYKKWAKKHRARGDT